MKKKEALLLLVQTWVIRDQIFTMIQSNSAVAGIIAISDESIIPDNVERACEEYCFWMRSNGPNRKRPEWYIIERSEHSDSYPFPWASLVK